MKFKTGLVIGLVTAGVAAAVDKLMLKPELIFLYTLIGGGLGHAVGQLFLLILGRWIE